MGFFQDITGKTAADAARDSRRSLEKAGDDARGYIDTGLDSSVNAVRGGNTGARTALDQAYRTGVGAIDNGINVAGGILDSSTGEARGSIGQAKTDALAALDPLKALASKYGAGTSLYLDALGVNGADAAAKAKSAFTPSLSYNFDLDQGLEAINRRRNAAGMLDSGNADRDSQDYAVGLASKESNGWLDRLAGLINPEMAATSTAATTGAGISQNMGLADANLVATTGKNKAQLEASRGSMLADLAQRYGTGTANIDTSEGNRLADLFTGAGKDKANITTNMAQPIANTFGQEAAAWGAGSGNLLNLGMNLASMAAGGLGGGLPSLSAPSLGGNYALNMAGNGMTNANGFLVGGV